MVIQARRQDRLDQTVAEIAAQGGKALAVIGDAGVPEDIDRLLERTLAWKEGGGQVDRETLSVF